MSNANFNRDKKTTIIGCLLLLIGVTFYVLDLAVELKKDVNHWINSGMIVSGIFLIASPDKWFDLMGQYFKSFFGKNE